MAVAARVAVRVRVLVRVRVAVTVGVRTPVSLGGGGRLREGDILQGEEEGGEKTQRDG